MTEQNISQSTKMALELGPVLLFFAGYTLVKDRTFLVFGVEYSGFIAATAAFIPLLLASSAILWRLTGKLSRMQLLTAVLVVVLGGMGIWFNDERFFKMKPTIVYAVFAVVLGAGLVRGRSLLQYVMDEAIPLNREGWMTLTRRTALLFAGLALANELIWRTMSTDAWVTFKTFVATGAIILFFGFNVFFLARAEMHEPTAEE